MLPFAGSFRRKPIAQALGLEGSGGMHRVLGAGHLTLFGVGAIVGAGIFSSIGQMAAGSPGVPGAGPALCLSYVLTAIVCGLAALCYAEIAALIPAAGSAYSYAFAAFGEIWAWIIGWDLIIEYAIGNVYVAQSWSDYFRSFLRGVAGVDLPGWLASDFQTAALDPLISAGAPRIAGHVVAVNLPAAAITILLTVVLVSGIRQSARLNSLLVLFKLGLIGVFVAVGAVYLRPANWRPFAPGGWKGIWTGASLAFFSYIGFDAISTVAEETRAPERALPRAMLASLAICAVLYVVTAAVMTGLVPSSQLGTGDPLAHALRSAGLDRLATLMAFGSVVAVTAVLLVFQLGQARILLAMARDGLLPAAFARLHPRRGTPVFGTIVTGAFVAVMPTLLTPSQALELTSIGTLFAFIVVAGGVIALRRSEPDRPRPFRCPGYPWTPLASIAASLGLMLGLPATNFWRFGIWLVVGLIIYGVGRRRAGRMRSTLSVCVVFAGLAASAHAQPAVRVRLDYELGEGASACPNVRAVAAAVAGRLGYEPFDPAASERVKVTVGKVRSVLEARIERLAPSGMPTAERVLTSRQTDCRELASAMELAITIAIDPFRAAPQPPPAPPPVVLPAAPPRPDPPAAAIQVAAPAPPPAAPASPEPVIGQVALGVVGAIGLAPSRTLGLVGGVGARRGRLSLGLEGRADLAASVPLQVGEVSASLLVASLIPCVHAGRFAACALMTAGALRAAGHGLIEARQITAAYLALGARGAVAFPVAPNLAVIAQADVATPLVETELRVDGQELWTTPPVSLSLGVALALSFP